MIKTFGLSHIVLAVCDLEKSLKFYQKVFGVKEYYRDKNQIQVIGPSGSDVIAFEKNEKLAGKSAGVLHFGFRLINPKDIDEAAKLVVEAGGKIKERGFFTPDEPYLFAYDPDGYEVEIWYEPHSSQ